MSRYIFQISLLIAATITSWAMSGHVAVAAQPLETVSGTGCYTYGDDQTPGLAKRAALALAQEQAVRSHHVFVQSSSIVRNFQLEEDVVTTASTGILLHTRIDKETQEGQKICKSITAQISPVKLDELIQQKAKAKKVADAAQIPVLTEGSSFELKVWANKQAGEIYMEGENLEVFVRSNRDAFLKIDYYQANGTVVHLVPNLFVDDAFVQAGKTYTFGGKHARYGFRVAAPFGAEAIKAVASTNPLDSLLPSDKKTEDSEPYLNTFHTQMRGIMVIPNPGQPAQWAEAAFGLTTISKSALEQSQLLSSVRGRK